MGNGIYNDSIYHWQNVQNLHFFRKYDRNLHFFFKNRVEIYICILFENRTEILSMVDGLTIRLQNMAFPLDAFWYFWFELNHIFQQPCSFSGLMFVGNPSWDMPLTTLTTTCLETGPKWGSQRCSGTSSNNSSSRQRHLETGGGTR